MKTKLKRLKNAYRLCKRIPEEIHGWNEMETGGTGIELNLLLLAHSLEKGMSLPNPRSGFGYDKAVALMDQLESYHSARMDESRYAFIESISVLGAYIAFTDNDMTAIKARYKLLAADVEMNHSGFDSVHNIDTIYDALNLEQDRYFITSRHSIRSYEPRRIDEDTLKKVIELASYAPSACNRQPVKVYITTNDDKVEAVSELIPGNKGFEHEIPNWAIVSVDRGMFNVGEPLQWYINGGIYLSYLVEAFHAYHIGSCIFQIPSSHSNTPKLRDLAAIPQDEAIIAAVGFGYPQKQNKFVAAARRPVDEVLVRF